MLWELSESNIGTIGGVTQPSTQMDIDAIEEEEESSVTAANHGISHSTVTDLLDLDL